MTIWFAQNSSVNIDSVNQWNDVADGSGNWLTWASLDPADILVANAKTAITINVSFTCVRITTSNADGGTAGGGFTLAAGVTVTANLVAGTTTCVTRTAAGDESFITGNVTGGTTNAHGANNDSTGTLTITGDVTGGTFNSGSGTRNSSSGTVNIIGDVFGGTAGNDTDGAQNFSTGTLTITGNVTGGTGTHPTLAPAGANNGSTGTLTITGDVTGGNLGGQGARNVSTGTLTITGNVTGGSGSGNAFGARNSSTGTLHVYGIAIGNDHGLGFATNSGSPGIFGFGTNTGTQQATTTVQGIKYGAKGQSPTAGLVQIGIGDLANSFASFRGEPTTFIEYVFGPQEFIGGQPTEADVRESTTYNFGLRTGTLIVPNPAYVSLGVETDNTVGSLTAGLDETALHDALDTYTNKDNWKATGFPTVAAFEARTLPSAEYFVVGDYTEPPTVDAIQSGLATEAKQDTAKTAIDAILLDTDETIPGLIAAAGSDATLAKQEEILAAVGAIEGGGGDATEANQVAILAALSGVEAIQVASPNVRGNLVLTQGDTYDGIGNPKAMWNVTTDYTDGWAVVLTIRDKDDAVVYTTTGTVDSATVVSVAITTPTVTPMAGCPGSWQGKFDVQLSKAGSVKTIALGVVYVNEDQTR